MRHKLRSMTAVAAVAALLLGGFGDTAAALASDFNSSPWGEPSATLMTQFVKRVQKLYPHR